MKSFPTFPRRREEAHGGQTWKIAYADFITALMSLFLVLWVSGESQQVRESIEDYFQSRMTRTVRHAAGILPSRPLVSGPTRGAENPSSGRPAGAKLDERLVRSLGELPSRYENRTLRAEATPQGILLHVEDPADQPLFTPEGAQLTEYGRWLFEILGWELARHPSSRVQITQELPPDGTPSVSATKLNLATARAQAVRDGLVAGGVTLQQVTRVAGGTTQTVSNRPALRLLVHAPEALP